jgi:hypothetical protein
MSAALIQLLTNQGKQGGMYACEIRHCRNALGLPRDELIRSVVVQADQVVKYQIEGYDVPVHQILPGWWYMDFSNLNSLGADPFFHISGLPAVNRVWTNIVYLDPPFKKWALHQPYCSAVPLRCPHRNEVHVAKLQHASGFDLLTDISWRGCPGPVKVKCHGFVLFELPDAETRQAAEIMCRGASSFHLGNCMLPRTEWGVTVADAGQQAIRGIRSRL